MSKGQPWSVDELRTLMQRYPNATAKEIAVGMGRSVSGIYQRARFLDLHKSAEFLESDKACRIARGKQTTSMKANQFKRGQAAWNQGLKGVVGVQPECRATQFKPGAKPHTWLPVGSIRITKDGYAQRKVTDTGNPPKDWRSVHSLAWEQANGPIPAGHVVVFKTGRMTTDPDAITVDALDLLSRADLMRRNSVHTVYPPELARLVILTGAVNRQINKRAKEEAA